MEILSMFHSGRKLLDLLFEYNKIPVRVLNSNLQVLHSSFDVELFWNTNFHSELYRPLIPKKDGIPALCASNSIEMMSSFSFTSQGKEYYLVIGPALLTRPHSSTKNYSFTFFPPMRPDDLEKLICIMPPVSITQFASFVRLLYTAFTDREVTVREIIEQSTEINTPHSISRALSNSMFEQREKKSDHGSYAQELLLLNTIKSGDLDALEYFAGSFLPREEFRLSSDPLRQSIYSFITAITLITRFAVEGGLDEELAFNMCEVYVQKVDHCRTSLEVTSLLYTAAQDFTSRIRDTRQQISYSNHIIRCTDYIFRHLHESVSLEDLSRETGLSPAYLSVLFKKETGMPLADFIQLQRVEEAKNLLRFSDYQISEISSFLAFSSQSYFTSVFKRHTGMTPKKYRELYFRKNWS
ncbi:MAG: helix-turn-helix domain-containing protein [Oscillospiraceae bacterium]|jgi:AraC-like DNA-binding protein